MTNTSKVKTRSFSAEDLSDLISGEEKIGSIVDDVVDDGFDSVYCDYFQQIIFFALDDHKFYRTTYEVGAKGKDCFDSDIVECEQVEETEAFTSVWEGVAESDAK